MATHTNWDSSIVSRAAEEYRFTAILPGRPSHCWINDLPDELLSDILVTVDPPRSRLPVAAACWPDDIQLRKPNFQVLAQLVCKTWRAIVLHTPALCSILDLGRMHAIDLPLFLRRSGIRPLYIDLNITRDTRDQQELRFRKNLELTLREHGSRVPQLCLSGVYLSVFLRHFRDLLANLVNLRELALNGSLLGDWTPIPVCANLEYLSIVERQHVRLSLDGFFASLRGCPNLRALHLETQNLGKRPGGNVLLGAHQHVTLLKLEELWIRNFYLGEMEMIFGALDAPRLKVFVASGLFGWMGIPQLLGLRCPELETLVLEGLDLSLGIAAGIPRVKHLVLAQNPLVDPEGMERGFQILSSHWKSQPDPLPLETLKTDKVKLLSLLSLLGGDRQTIPNLHKITVHYMDVFCSDHPAEFKRRSRQWTKLSSLVEAEVYGLPAEAIKTRMKITSWEREREWFKKLVRPSE